MLQRKQVEGNLEWLGYHYLVTEEETEAGERVQRVKVRVVQARRAELQI